MGHNQIIMMGTGNAIATRCYNTCFVLKTPEALLLIDAGGGNGILSQLEKSSVALTDIHDMFVTHAHTDHILGALWVIRMVIHRMKNGEYKGTFKVYGHDKVLGVLDWMCHAMLPKKDLTYLDTAVLFCEKKSGDKFRIGDMQMECFDVLSTKEKQFGFRAGFPDGQVLVCLGDEPYNDSNRCYVENADWLLCEAFCLYKDREIFKPYEKHHSTALEAGTLASKLNVRNLLLYHTEDRSLASRKKEYTEEAKLNYAGKVFVPDDLELIDME